MRDIRHRDHPALRRRRRPAPSTPARNLSGGNLQKVVLGASSRTTRSCSSWRSRPGPRRRRDRDGPLVPARCSRRGRGVLLISEDLDEIRALADRISSSTRARSSASSRRAPLRSRTSGCSWPAYARDQARAPARPALVAVRRRARGLAGGRVRDHGRCARGQRARARDRRSASIVEAGFTGNGRCRRR